MCEGRESRIATVSVRAGYTMTLTINVWGRPPKTSQSFPPAGVKKLGSFFTATSAWEKLPLRLPVWNFAACGKIMRAAGCKPLTRKIENYSGKLKKAAPKDSLFMI